MMNPDQERSELDPIENQEPLVHELDQDQVDSESELDLSDEAVPLTRPDASDESTDAPFDFDRPLEKPSEMEEEDQIPLDPELLTESLGIRL